jgi:flagellar protein FliS
MSVQAYQQYQRTQTQTASPGELVVMMYKGAIKFLGSARQNLELRDLEATNRQLLRAQEIILELMISVDVNVGPVAKNLFDLYEFMHGHLVQANIRKDGQMIGEVEQLLRDLVPAWEQAVQTSRKVTPLPSAAAFGAPAAQLQYASA